MRSVVLGITALAAFLTAGCGGGGGGAAGGGGGGGAGAASVSQGVITAKGSITVNGVKYDTSGAIIRVDDNPGVEGDLKEGMVVKVKGTITGNNGVATEVEFHDNIQGAIQAIDPAAKTITVMGQTVRIEDNLTRFADDNAKTLAASGLQVGDIVQVSGFPDDKGGLRATRVEDAPDAELEIKGFVSALDTDAKTFTLKVTPTATDFFTVNYTVLPAGVVNGSYVEVKTVAAVVGGVITASAIQLEDAKLGAANQKAEVEGLVTSGDSTSFVINGITITTSGATVFENGVAADIVPNVHLEAEGKLNGSGVLVATKISFRNNLRIQGLVTAKTGAAKNGTLTLLGLTVSTGETTDFRLDGGVPVTIDTIVPNTTRVEIRGFIGRDGVLIANRVEVTNDTKEILQGPISAKDGVAGTVTIAGLVVTTDGSTEYRNAVDAAVTKAQFFALITAGPAPVPFSVVKVRLNPGTLVADQIEVEGDR